MPGTGLGVGEMGETANGASLQSDKKVLKLTVVLVVQLYEYIENH